MPIDRKSSAKATRYDRAQKYVREKAEEALMDLHQALPSERADYIRNHLFRAYITGYERAKRVDVIADLRAQLTAALEDKRRFVEALKWYADSPPPHTYYIVEAKDGTFLSDMATWGDKARAAMKERG